MIVAGYWYPSPRAPSSIIQAMASRKPGDQTGRAPSRQNNTYIKWIAVYSDSKASSLCLASRPALGGRPPFCGASRRFIVPSRACTNSALPRGRPVWVHRRISSAWVPSRQPLGTAARHWQSNFSAMAPNLRPRSAIPLRSALPRWTTPTLPPPSPSRRAPGSTPYSATLPTDAPDPMGMSNNDPARHGRSTDEPHSNKSHSAHGYASGPIPSRQYCEE